jgi:hypothetical protein
MPVVGRLRRHAGGAGARDNDLEIHFTGDEVME